MGNEAAIGGDIWAQLKAGNTFGDGPVKAEPINTTRASVVHADADTRDLVLRQQGARAVDVKSLPNPTQRDAIKPVYLSVGTDEPLEFQRAREVLVNSSLTADKMYYELRSLVQVRPGASEPEYKQAMRELIRQSTAGHKNEMLDAISDLAQRDLAGVQMLYLTHETLDDYCGRSPRRNDGNDFLQAALKDTVDSSLRQMRRAHVDLDTRTLAQMHDILTDCSSDPELKVLRLRAVAKIRGLTEPLNANELNHQAVRNRIGKIYEEVGTDFVARLTTAEQLNLQKTLELVDRYFGNRVTAAFSGGKAQLVEDNQIQAELARQLAANAGSKSALPQASAAPQSTVTRLSPSITIRDLPSPAPTNNRPSAPRAQTEIRPLPGAQSSVQVRDLPQGATQVGAAVETAQALPTAPIETARPAKIDTARAVVLSSPVEVQPGVTISDVTTAPASAAGVKIEESGHGYFRGDHSSAAVSVKQGLNDPSAVQDALMARAASGALSADEISESARALVASLQSQYGSKDEIKAALKKALVDNRGATLAKVDELTGEQRQAAAAALEMFQERLDRELGGWGDNNSFQRDIKRRLRH